MQSDALIVKSNSLIRSRYDYTLAELRLVLTVASMVQADDKDFHEYSVEAKEFAELMGESTPQNTYKALKQLGKDLLSKPLEIPTGNGFALCNWFAWYEYQEKEGRILCSFAPKLKPHLLELQSHFTKYNLSNILRMKSTYAIRLYELAKSWEDTGWFIVGVEDFKATMGCKDSYPLYADLKRKVINRAIKEINELTDIEILCNEKKTGRKVTGLDFRVRAKYTPPKLIREGIEMNEEQFEKFVISLDSTVIDQKDFKKGVMNLADYHGVKIDTEILAKLKKALADYRKKNSLF